MAFHVCYNNKKSPAKSSFLSEKRINVIIHEKYFRYYDDYNKIVTSVLMQRITDSVENKYDDTQINRKS